MVHKILVIGSGAREHAIARALNRSPQKKEIYCLATNMNPGISELCDKLTVGNINDPKLVVSYSQETGCVLAIIGPKTPWRMVLPMHCGMPA